MKKNNNNVKEKSFTYEDLVSSVAAKSGSTLVKTKAVLRALSEVVEERVKKTSPNEDLNFKLINGIVIESKYKPETTRLNNLTKKIETVPDRIAVTARVTQTLKDKVNVKI